MQTIYQIIDNKDNIIKEYKAKHFATKYVANNKEVKIKEVTANNETKPQSKDVKPQSNETKPQSKDVKPQSKDVKIELTNEKEFLNILNKVYKDTKSVTNANIELFTFIYPLLKTYDKKDFLIFTKNHLDKKEAQNKDFIANINHIFNVANSFKEVNITLKFSWLYLSVIEDITRVLTRVNKTNSKDLNKAKETLKKVFVTMEKELKLTDKQKQSTNINYIVHYNAKMKSAIEEVKKDFVKTKKINVYQSLKDSITNKLELLTPKQRETLKALF